MNPTTRRVEPGTLSVHITNDNRDSNQERRITRTVQQSTRPVFDDYSASDLQKYQTKQLPEEHKLEELQTRGQKRMREESPERKITKASRRDDETTPNSDRKEQRYSTGSQSEANRYAAPRQGRYSTSTVEQRSTANKVKEHFLPMKGEIYMQYIESGIKKFEGRIYGTACKNMHVGDNLKLFDNRAGWGIICKITSIDVYYSFKAMLEEKGILNMLPQLTAESKTLPHTTLLERGVQIYRGFPGSQRVSQVGVTAIGVEFIKRIYSRQG
jgi:ASC-1-like (ASCH) protein